MHQIDIPIVGLAALLPLLSGATPREGEPEGLPGVQRAAEFRGGSFLGGSTIVSFSPPGFQPDVIYKKYPSDEFVGPAEVFEISFGVLLPGAGSSVPVMLSLASPGKNPDLQITDDSATFLTQDGFHHNYDPSERFKIAYQGTLNPYIGPIDFLLEPDGFPARSVRVHLNTIEQPGFPISFFPQTSATSPVGNIVGDGKLEILVPGERAGVQGLHAFDHAGNPLTGWPLHNDDPDIIDQSFVTPNLVDLDGDGLDEVVVVGFVSRKEKGPTSTSGSVTSQTLSVAEGSGVIRWQVTDDFESITIPAVGDLDGDANLDIVVAGDFNLKRFDIQGVQLPGWQVETLNNIRVYVPAIADLDGNPDNGQEIIACAPLSGQPARFQLYVWNHDGSLHGPNWPQQILGHCHPSTVLNLDHDPSNGLEIVIAVDHDTDPPVDPKTGFLNTFSVFAFHADGGNVSGWPHHFLRDPNLVFVDDRIISGCSAADIDGDGDLEVVVGTYGLGDPENGNLFVFHHDGTLDANWPQWAGIAQTPSHWGGRALGDLDGDGILEIVTASFRGVYVFRADGQLFDGFPKMTSDDFAQPMIADLDGDGRLEIVEASLWDHLYVWKFATPAPDRLPWPRFRQNSRNTGTHDRGPAAPLPTLSGAGWAATFCLMLCLGAVIIRRRAVESVGTL